MPGMFGGKKKPSGGGGGAGGGGAAAAKKMFTPEQVTQATKDYGAAGTAKWNQILANMGAGGGTGGDLPAAIQSQATTMGEQLGGVTAGQYAPETSIEQVMRALEGGIGAKYPVY